MLKEPELITCPNPKCRRKIGELILVSDVSTRPIKRYYGCPYCFFEVDVLSAQFLRKEEIRVHAEEAVTRKDGKKERKNKLDVDTENEEDYIEESASSPPMHPSLEKILDTISAGSQNKQEEPLVKPAEKEEKAPSRCPHHFGYLASRPNNTPIPEECLVCPKVLDCAMMRAHNGFFKT